jgi:phosphoserine phosphatase
MRTRKLVAFDLDGVLVKEKSAWWTLHNAFETYEDSRKNMNAYKSGEIDYPEFMRRDIGLWGQRTLREIKNTLGSYTLNPVADKVCRALRNCGYELAIVSAGLDIIARPVAVKLQIEHWTANGLEADENGYLTGNGIFRVDLMRKQDALSKLISHLGFSLAGTTAVGDSEYDFHLMSACGASVALVEDGASTIRWPSSTVKISRLGDLPRILGC